MSFFNSIKNLFKPNKSVAGVAGLAVAKDKIKKYVTTPPDQPDHDMNQQNNPTPTDGKTSTIQDNYRQVTQNRIDDVVQKAINLAEKFKADQRHADLEELDRAFNNVMHAERTGNRRAFMAALNELEALNKENFLAPESVAA